MKRIDLVFRSNGERTAAPAEELARRAIRPSKVFTIRDTRPFSAAVQKMLQIEHDAEFVVYLDADCLVLDDLRPFIDFNTRPFVDGLILDRFRGWSQCGIHILCRDLVESMRATPPSPWDPRHHLRPESALRNRAMETLGVAKHVKRLPVLHDFGQWHADLFTKIATRELRMRKPSDKARLDRIAAAWGDDPECRVAQAAIHAARGAIPDDAALQDLPAYLGKLPAIAAETVGRMRLPAQAAFSQAELGDLRTHTLEPLARPAIKVFGIGLDRTGTQSLNAALARLGWDAEHNPDDAASREDAARGDGRFELLDHYDGITGITAAAFFRELDAAWPGSRFVLTLRDEDRWLESIYAHRDRLQDPVRAPLYRRSTYRERALRTAFRRHLDEVRSWFADRPDDLLEVNLLKAGDWAPLCRFLQTGLPDQPFPHRGKRAGPRRDSPPGPLTRLADRFRT